MISKRIPKLAGTLCAGLLCLAALPGASGEERQDALASGFQNPPAAAHPLTWWHWINGNVTKEGIKADMEDMKRVGIAGMQMLDVSIYLPEGPVRYGSDSWYEHIEYAIETASRLGLEFTIMNGPGWSASGGPWVTPELSMKELVWSETPIDGGSSLTQKLEQPRTRLGFYRDVAVFAVPSDPASEGTAVISSNIPGLDLEKLTDGKPQTGVQIPGKPGKNPAITFSYPQPQERRLFRLTFANRDKRGRLAGAIEASQDGSTFEKIRDFSFDGGPELSSAIEIPFTLTRALAFRVTFNVVSQDFWPLPVAELEFSREYRTENFRSKIVDSGLRPILPTTAPISADPDAIPLEKVINLTSHLGEDGTLRWDAPAGKWTVLRFGYTSTARTNHPAQPEGKGLEVDKMDASAVRAYFNTSLGRIIKTAGPHAGKAFGGVLLDSWEAGQQNWTRNFSQEFQTLRGYDLMPYLPVLAGRVIGSPAQTEAVLSDFRHCVADLVEQRYFGVLREESNKHGLKFYGEAYGGACFNELQCASKVDVNMSEFWAHSTGDLTRVKSVASAVHTLGQTISAAESFTARPEEGRWRQVPADLKPVGDLAFLSGLNRAIFHTYAHQPYLDLEPGFTLGRYGTHFGRTNTWWPQAKAWIDYLSRCQFLLQSGRFVGDFLALEHDDVSELMVSNLPKLPQGYGFDLISPAQFKKVTTANHQACLPNGVPYRAVILPPVWAADLALLRQIETLVDAGVPVFGPAPSVPTGLRDVNENGAAWKAAVERLWPREGTSGQPRVRGGNEIAPWLAETGVAPDFTFTARESKANVRAIHRATPDADFYFVSNQSGAPVHVSASFRISGKQPEIWNPVTGEMAPATVFRTDRSQTTVDLPLEAGGSAFVVFRSPLPPRWIASVEGPGGDGVVPTSASGERLTLASRDPVTVTFRDGKQRTVAARDLVEPPEMGPAWHVKFQPPHGKTFQRDFANLHLWRDDADSAVRYFSGHAAYRTEFSLPNKPIPAALRYRIDLGKVYDLAEVKINGQSAGILWTEPFAVDVTRLLKPGRNTLEVIVTDRWVNRLIGDEQFPQDASYKTNGSIFDTGALARFPGWWNDPAKRKSRQRSTFATWHFYEANSPLIESGLMGPVKLSASEVVSLK